MVFDGVDPNDGEPLPVRVADLDRVGLFVDEIVEVGVMVGVTLGGSKRAHRPGTI